MPPTKGPFQRLIEHQPPLTIQQLRAQRVELMKQIQAVRGRPLVVYATSMNVPDPRIPAYIHREDLIPLGEVLDSVPGKELDVLIETPGGLAEVTVEIVKLLRPRFDHVAFIVPHVAMSAGTILAMAGDEILMDHRSSLGAIDPQLPTSDGRLQPAQAILQGIDTIRQSVKDNGGQLDPTYVPILRNIDPGKLQTALNASEMSKQLVATWLAMYKFRDWTKHASKHASSEGAPVTPEQRESRASDIAAKLCDHQKWLSHSRPIKIDELEAMRLRITNYGKTPALQQAIWELWVNLSHFMASTNIYKAYESATVEFFKFALPQPSVPQKPAAAGPGKAIVEVRCGKCGTVQRIQANLGASQPLDAGVVPFPKDGLLACPGCGDKINLMGLKLQLEAQTRQPVIL